MKYTNLVLSIILRSFGSIFMKQLGGFSKLMYTPIKIVANITCSSFPFQGLKILLLRNAYAICDGHGIILTGSSELY